MFLIKETLNFPVGGNCWGPDLDSRVDYFADQTYIHWKQLVQSSPYVLRHCHEGAIHLGPSFWYLWHPKILTSDQGNTCMWKITLQVVSSVVILSSFMLRVATAAIISLVMNSAGRPDHGSSTSEQHPHLVHIPILPQWNMQDCYHSTLHPIAYEFSRQLFPFCGEFYHCSSLKILISIIGWWLSTQNAVKIHKDNF